MENLFASIQSPRTANLFLARADRPTIESQYWIVLDAAGARIGPKACGPYDSRSSMPFGTAGGPAQAASVVFLAP